MTHTDKRYWENNVTYKIKKEYLKNKLIKSVCDILGIKKQIVDQFAATPKHLHVTSTVLN